MSPPLEHPNRFVPQNRVSPFKVTIFTILQARSAAPLTTFVNPSIRVDDSLHKTVHWFSRLLFSCINGCVVMWIPGSVFTILAMNFNHPCIGGFTLDSFRCDACSSFFLFLNFFLLLLFAVQSLALTNIFKAPARVSCFNARNRRPNIHQK